MAVEDAIAAALLVTLSATLALLAFLVALAEGAVIGLLVLGVLPGASMPLFLVAGVQIAILVLIYAATFSRE